MFQGILSFVCKYYLYILIIADIQTEGNQYPKPKERRSPSTPPFQFTTNSFNKPDPERKGQMVSTDRHMTTQDTTYTHNISLNTSNSKGTLTIYGTAHK